MDAQVRKTKQRAGFVPWRPTPGPRGEVTIGAEYWDDDILRYKLGSPTPEHYLRLWSIRWLKFQGKYAGVKPFEKPEHYPTPEQVEEYLEWSAAEVQRKERLALMAKVAARPVQRPTVVRVEPVRPAPPVQEEETAEELEDPKPTLRPPEPTPPPPPPLVFDLDESAKKYSGLTKREKEIVEDVLHHKKPLGLTEASLRATISFLCTKVGIPKTNRWVGGDRREALRQVHARYKALLDEGAVTEKVSLKEQRLRMLCNAARAIWEESGKKLKLLRAASVFRRAEADNPGGSKFADLHTCFYYNLNDAERESILQVHKFK